MRLSLPITAVAAVLLFSHAAFADAKHHGKGEMKSLKAETLGDENAVSFFSYCKGTYVIFTHAGTRHEVKEFNLRFKTDTSDTGPSLGKPAVISAGMGGDRKFIVFASLEDMGMFLGNALALNFNSAGCK